MSDEETEKRDSRKKYSKLPNFIIPIDNPDKEFHEEWTPRRIQDLGNFPSPHQVVLSAGMNSGKTLTIKTLILHQKPMYERILLIHGDSGTLEYDDLEIPDEDKYTENNFPKLEVFQDKPRNEKWAVVIEEVAFSKANEKELSKLARTISTHYTVSLYLSYQNFVDIPKIFRRTANIFILWPCRDKFQESAIEKRVGFKHGTLSNIFEKHCTHKYDSICLDYTKDSPAPVRKNIFEKLEL
jgi:hypothetical protein